MKTTSMALLSCLATFSMARADYVPGRVRDVQKSTNLFLMDENYDPIEKIKMSFSAQAEDGRQGMVSFTIVTERADYCYNAAALCNGRRKEAVVYDVRGFSSYGNVTTFVARERQPGAVLLSRTLVVTENTDTKELSIAEHRLDSSPEPLRYEGDYEDLVVTTSGLP